MEKEKVEFFLGREFGGQEIFEMHVPMLRRMLENFVIARQIPIYKHGLKVTLIF